MNVSAVLVSLQSLLGEPNKYVLFTSPSRVFADVMCEQCIPPERPSSRVLGQRSRRVQEAGFAPPSGSRGRRRVID